MANTACEITNVVSKGQMVGHDLNSLEDEGLCMPQ